MNSLFPFISIQHFIDEDLGHGDMTANLISSTQLATAQVITRENMVVCGQTWFEQILHYFDSEITCQWLVNEAEFVAANTCLVEIKGRAKPMLSAERTALNLLQTLSATATITRQYVNAIAGTGCRILDTRKTIPGLRLAQKYAVRCGGGQNHRLGLYDAVLIKENHIMALGSIAAAVEMARQQTALMVEVEVESIAELQQALAAKPDRILLDNFSIAQLREAVLLTHSAIELEASGDIRLDNIREVANTGIDYISIGALTKHIQAIDLSMRIKFLE